MKSKEVKKSVRDSYAKVARRGSSCCGDSPKSTDVSKAIGYSQEELLSIPDASNMGLGCGNPTAIASLKEGEVVLDLGAGGGLDCFLSSQKVGPTGKVIGVDMTPDMIDLARDNAEKNNFTNVEFRLGEIENLPVADNSVDIIISNCVINLSPEKQRVFDEAYRVLRPGGRIAISDIVLLKPLPDSIRDNKKLLAACISGAELKNRYLEMIENAGFKDIQVQQKGTNLKHEVKGEKKEGKPKSKLIIGGEEVDLEDVDVDIEDVMSIGESIQSINVTAKKN